MTQFAEPRDEQILNRAYKIWEDNGKPGGREDEFWQRAQEELRQEASGTERGVS